VGLDRREISEQLRDEIGGTRLAAHKSDQFEPIDPARAMPRWLIPVVIAAIIAVALLANWLNNRSQNAPDNVVAEQSETLGTPAALAAPTSAPAANATGPVTITATEQAWIQVKDGARVIKEGVLEPGQSFAVPPTASAPSLLTGKAEALRITVGTQAAPQVGPAATRIANVSLLGADLMRGPAPTPANAPVTASPAPARSTPASPAQ
jgi:hypothetical protein